MQNKKHVQCRTRCHYGQFYCGWRMKKIFSQENGLNLLRFSERLHDGSSGCRMQRCEFKVKHSPAYLWFFSAVYILLLLPIWGSSLNLCKWKQFGFGPCGKKRISQGTVSGNLETPTAKQNRLRFSVLFSLLNTQFLKGEISRIDFFRVWPWPGRGWVAVAVWPWPGGVAG